VKNQKTGFVSGTMVHTAGGLKPIQTLHIGDLVLTRSPQGETIYKPITQIDKTVQAIYRCTLLEQQPNDHCTIYYLFSAAEQQIFTDTDWIRVFDNHQKAYSAYNLNQQNLNLGQPKPIFAASNRKQQTFGFNAATFSHDIQPNGQDDEFIYISPEGLIHHQTNHPQYCFAKVTAPLYRDSINWSTINKKTLVLPVFQLHLANSDNYFVGDEGILARAA
jgi:hypothetical protein